MVNEYYGDLNIYHFDGYRITSDDWLNSGFDEYLYAGGICIIEWAENIENILPEGTIKISITKDLSIGDNYRLIVTGEK